MEISKTIKFVGPFNKQLTKKLFPIFLILNILLLPLKIYFSSSFLTEIISLFIDGIIFLLIIDDLKKILQVSPDFDLIIGSRYVSGGGSQGWDFKRKLLFN